MASISPRVGGAQTSAPTPIGRDGFEWPPTPHDLEKVNVYSPDGRAVGLVPIDALSDESEAWLPPARPSPLGRRRLRPALVAVIAVGLAVLWMTQYQETDVIERGPGTSAAPRAAAPWRLPPVPNSRASSVLPHDVSGSGTPAPQGLVEAPRATRPEAPLAGHIPPAADLPRDSDLAAPSRTDGAAIAEPVRPVEIVRPLQEAPPSSLAERDRAAAAATFAAPPAASAPATPMVSTPAATEEMAAVESARPLIGDVVQRFRDALERGDLAATAQVWPGVDVRALERSFRTVRSQRLVFGVCRIEMTGEAAQVSCPGTLSYTPRVGGDAAKTVNGEWRIDMARVDRAWRITGVEAR